MSVVCKLVGRLFNYIVALVVAAVAVVMLGASAVLLFNIALSSDADRRTVPASFPRPAVSFVPVGVGRREQPVVQVGRSEQPVVEMVRSEQPAAEVILSEQPVADVVEPREQLPEQKKVATRKMPKKRAAKQQPMPRFAERGPYYSFSWGGGPYHHW